MWIKKQIGTILLITFRKGKLFFSFPFPVFVLQSLIESIDDLSFLIDTLILRFTKTKFKLAPFTTGILLSLNEINLMKNENLSEIEVNDLYIKIHTY